jgi:MGT family glycosyltransferase
MPKVLFVSNPFYGHAAPLLAIAQALLEQDVDVIWSVDKRFTGLCRVIEDLGIPVYSHPNLQFLVTEEERRGMHNVTGQTSLPKLLYSLSQMKWKVFKRHRQSFFPDTALLERQVDALHEIVQETQPDGIVTEACVRVPMVAERSGLPWAYVGISSASIPEVNYDLPDGFLIVSDSTPKPLRDLVRAVWRKRFYEQGAKYLVSPYLNLLGSTPEIEGINSLETPIEFVGSLLYDGQVDLTIPSWFFELPTDKPLVYVTVGTSVVGTDFLEIAMQALSELDVEVIITVGMQHDVTEFNPPSDNIHIARWIPNHLIMPKANVAIIHGALSTAIGCLSAGIPAIVMGWYIDQGLYAFRFERLGVGKRLPFWKISKNRLQDAVRTILSDPRYRERARQLQASIESYGGPEQAASLVLQMINES